MSTRWEVVGGADKGGVLVREGESGKSKEAKERLQTGAIVETISQNKERLHFRLISGTGPAEGWVSTKTKNKTLLKKLDPAAAAGGAASSANSTKKEKKEEKKEEKPAEEKPASLVEDIKHDGVVGGVTHWLSDHMPGHHKAGDDKAAAEKKAAEEKAAAEKKAAEEKAAAEKKEAAEKKKAEEKAAKEKAAAEKKAKEAAEKKAAEEKAAAEKKAAEEKAAAEKKAKEAAEKKAAEEKAAKEKAAAEKKAAEEKAAAEKKAKEAAAKKAAEEKAAAEKAAAEKKAAEEKAAAEKAAAEKKAAEEKAAAEKAAAEKKAAEEKAAAEAAAKKAAEEKAAAEAAAKKAAEEKAAAEKAAAEKKAAEELAAAEAALKAAVEAEKKAAEEKKAKEAAEKAAAEAAAIAAAEKAAAEKAAAEAAAAAAAAAEKAAAEKAAAEKAAKVLGPEKAAQHVSYHIGGGIRVVYGTSYVAPKDDDGELQEAVELFKKYSQDNIDLNEFEKGITNLKATEQSIGSKYVKKATFRAAPEADSSTSEALGLLKKLETKGYDDVLEAMEAIQPDGEIDENGAELEPEFEPPPVADPVKLLSKPEKPSAYEAVDFFNTLSTKAEAPTTRSLSKAEPLLTFTRSATEALDFLNDGGDVVEAEQGAEAFEIIGGHSGIIELHEIAEGNTTMEVHVQHFNDGTVVDVEVPKTATMRDVKEAVVAKNGSYSDFDAAVEQLSLIKRVGARIMIYPDDELVGTHRFKLFGVGIPFTA